MLYKHKSSAAYMNPQNNCQNTFYKPPTPPPLPSSFNFLLSPPICSHQFFVCLSVFLLCLHLVSSLWFWSCCYWFLVCVVWVKWLITLQETEMKLNKLVRYTIILNCFFLNEADEDGIAQTVKPNKQSTTPQNSNQEAQLQSPIGERHFSTGNRTDFTFTEKHCL